MQDPLVYLASSDPDTIYFDQVMKQPDRTDFMNAEIREVNSHCDIKHWKILTCKEVPKGQPILDLVWAMNRKRDIATRKVYKWKARLNIYGGKKEYMVNLLKTYSPVVTWFFIRTLLTLDSIIKWNYRQVDFIQAYPHAPIVYDLYNSEYVRLKKEPLEVGNRNP